MIIGKPIFFVIAKASSTVSTPPSEPGTNGTPAFFIKALADNLSPIASMFSGVGPMNVMPASLQALTKIGFSDKKP